jgi:type VI secretion system secreted protein VgrG
MRYTQKRRLLNVKSPLGPDILLLESFSGAEGISRPFMYELQMFSERQDIPANEIIGKNITVELQCEDREVRYFNGLVSGFSAGQLRMQGLREYRAEVVPWLWFLTRNIDCRIFQHKNVKQILQQVFEERGFSDYDLSQIQGEHPKHEYCVQYMESDLNFISRLMEEEGIFYWFSHDENKHTLMVADHTGGCLNCPEYEVPFSAGSMATGHLASWERQYKFTSGRWAHSDYNYELPQTNLLTNEKSVVDVSLAGKYEIFEYPGLYTKKEEGNTLSRVRMEEEEVRHNVIRATSCCRTFFSGGKFKVSKHESLAEKNEYLITSLEHSATCRSYVTGDEANDQYQNSLMCIPASVTFRPNRQTVRSKIFGTQTATVVGPKGQEIYTDEDGYGRVKVQFHWDRRGEKNEKSSCWVRVAQAFAGRKWGEFFLPRIGQEVVVTFLEGDPDRPLIIGAVYNAYNMPPIPLPDYRTMSGVKTNSLKAGGGFNALRFDDKENAEQIFMQAEKDQDIRVKNDRFEWVGQDRHLIVKRDKYEHVQNNRHAIIDKDHLEQVGNNRNLKIAGKEAIEIGGSQSLTVHGDVIEVFNASHSEKTGNEYYLRATNVVIEAMAGITLKCGGGSVVIDPAGVTVTGGMVTIDGGLVKIASGPGSPAASGTSGSAMSPESPEKAIEADLWEPDKGRRGG